MADKTCAALLEQLDERGIRLSLVSDVSWNARRIVFMPYWIHAPPLLVFCSMVSPTPRAMASTRPGMPLQFQSESMRYLNAHDVSVGLVLPADDALVGISVVVDVRVVQEQVCIADIDLRLLSDRILGTDRYPVAILIRK